MNVTREKPPIDCDIRSMKELIRLKVPNVIKRKKVLNSVQSIGVTIIRNGNDYIIWSPLEKSENVYALLLSLKVNVIG